MDVLEMTEKEQATNLMDKFIDLQRIKTGITSKNCRMKNSENARKKLLQE